MDGSESSQTGTRLNLLAHSSSMSPIKSFSALSRAKAASNKGKSKDERFAQFENEDGNVFNGEHYESSDNVFNDERYASTESHLRGGEHGQADSNLKTIVPWISRNHAAKEEVDQVDAQDIYPSTACVFVANLASNVSDEELEEEVMAVFEKFGKAFVKLRRDTRNMPYAFVQYTSDNDAQRAFENAQGIKISDRCCRVEKAKANSVFAVSKRSGEHISEDEAARLLRPLGQLSEVTPLDYETQRKFGLPPSVRVQFTLFDSGRDPVRAFKDHRFYRVASLELNKAPVAANSVNTKRELVNKRSVFIGDLPPNSSEEEIREMAIGCGKVLAVKVRTRAYVGSAEEICFAFVEFESAESVQDMIASYDGIELRGYRLRLQQRQSRTVMSTEDPFTPTPGRARSRAADSTPTSSRHTMSESWRDRQARQPTDESLKTPSRAPTRVYPSSDRVRTEGRWDRIQGDRTNNSTQSSSASATPQSTSATSQSTMADNIGAANQGALLRYLEQTSEQASMLAQFNNLTPPSAQRALVAGAAPTAAVPYGMNPFMMPPISPMASFQAAAFMNAGGLPLPGHFYASPYGCFDMHGYAQYPQLRPHDQVVTTPRGDETPTRGHYTRNRGEPYSNGSPSHRNQEEH
ncbi:unnamed protein product [Clonostachys rosea]|uniref:RRM domain-containing protein n=1 Tax=Bionectria ochroleuca TaxID=29856 RepID=A0ABY6UL29_BIOOC|nr:unnamed protein product [Clonostachys rosea]